MKAKPYMSIIIGFCILCLAVALWAMPVKKERIKQTIQVSKVAIDRAKVIHFQPTARFAGVTQAKNRAVLSFAVPARVVERLVDTGSQVRQGEILARLDDHEFRNTVQLAQAAVNELTARWQQAGRDRRRFEALAASDVVALSDLEKVTTQEAALAASLKGAGAQLKEARRLLSETVLKAPFSATVTGIHIQPGEFAVPGQPAIELSGEGNIELIVEVPESIISHMTQGQAVRVQLPFAQDRQVTGRIEALAKAAQTGGRLFPIKVALANEPGLSAGLTAQLIVERATQGALTVPLAAVVNPGASQPHVFIYHQGHVTKRPIEVGGIIEERIIVRGTISQGDQVVVSGQSRLMDGDEVAVVR